MRATETVPSAIRAQLISIHFLVILYRTILYSVAEIQRPYTKYHTAAYDGVLGGNRKNNPAKKVTIKANIVYGRTWFSISDPSRSRHSRRLSQIYAASYGRANQCRNHGTPGTERGHPCFHDCFHASLCEPSPMVARTSSVLPLDWYP